MYSCAMFVRGIILSLLVLLPDAVAVNSCWTFLRDSSERPIEYKRQTAREKMTSGFRALFDESGQNKVLDAVVYVAAGTLVEDFDLEFVEEIRRGAKGMRPAIYRVRATKAKYREALARGEFFRAAVEDSVKIRKTIEGNLAHARREIIPLRTKLQKSLKSLSDATARAVTWERAGRDRAAAEERERVETLRMQAFESGQKHAVMAAALSRNSAWSDWRFAKSPKDVDDKSILFPDGK